eukprot:gnl/MRDRNA2_/MRDRNA2_83220_c0_seq6.p1 gnl/MRDRNA2_/MRDRNA2_83220_c0~~gnl/MRDRNA2_/MRDRNA2_83220_c0_seq6.p1  ORF type:complete len:896 (-),score=172.79 gnl/MRDRNA2_/MRDRNA2_83220_c0_seq6:282-2969(-)
MVSESSSVRIAPESNTISSSSIMSPKSDSKIVRASLTSCHQVSWQWFKQHGDGSHEWKNYTDDETQMIETAFQRGATCVRLNAGNEDASKGNLKELFLADMIQYNPISGKVREIRRLGPDGLFKKISRWTRGYLESVSKGTVRHKSFIKYKKMMTGTAKEVKKKPARSEFCKRIVQSSQFTVLQMAAIILNTIFIGFDVEHNGPDAPEETQAIFQVINHAFCVFFTAEIFLRFGAMTKRKNIQKAIAKTLRDRWFCFDLILVLLMVLETWVVPLFFSGGAGLGNMSSLRLMRLMRLSRVGRVGRLLQVFPEILMMLKSIVAASRAVICTLAMLTVILYVFAIIFKAQSEESPLHEMFPTIPTAMWKLLIHGAFMDELAPIVDKIGAEDSSLAALFLAFVLLSNLIVLNMLIGVICDVATGVSEKEKEMMSSRALTGDLSEFLECFDMDSDQQISVQEFDLLLANPDVRCMLERHQVDVNTLKALKVSLFSDRDAQAAKNEDPQSADAGNTDEVHWKSLSCEELIETILRFRGGAGKQATMLDIISCERNLSSQIQQLEKLTYGGQTNPGATTLGKFKKAQRAISFRAKSKAATLPKKLKTSEAEESGQPDSMPESKSMPLPKTSKADSVSESKSLTMFEAIKQVSVKAGGELPEEFPAPERSSVTDKQHSVKVSSEPTTFAGGISISSKILEEQHDNLLTKLKEEFAQQQSVFEASILKEIHAHMKSSKGGQRKVSKQRAGNDSTSQSQVTEDGCPSPVEQSQSAPLSFLLEKIHEQMISAEVEQCEMFGQLARNRIPTQNRVTDEKCPLLAEQLQGADASAGPCEATAGNKPAGQSGSNIIASLDREVQEDITAGNKPPGRLGIAGNRPPERSHSNTITSPEREVHEDIVVELT